MPHIRNDMMGRCCSLWIWIALSLIISYSSFKQLQYNKSEKLINKRLYRRRERFKAQNSRVAESIPLEPNNSSFDLRAGLLMLGIQSVESEHNFALRQAARDTFLSENKIGYRFIFDKETPGLLEEQRLFGDLAFINSAYAGYAKAFGEKELQWLKYCKKHFPNYTLYGKADDDVFICAKEFSAHLQRIATRRLYYGFWWWHEWERNPGKFDGFAPFKDLLRKTDNSTTPWLPNIDEFLLIVGADLVDPVIHPSRKHCVPKRCSDKKPLKFAYGRLT